MNLPLRASEIEVMMRLKGIHICWEFISNIHHYKFHAEIYLLGDIWAIYELYSYKADYKNAYYTLQFKCRIFLLTKVLQGALALLSLFPGFAPDPASSS